MACAGFANALLGLHVCLLVFSSVSLSCAGEEELITEIDTYNYSYRSMITGDDAESPNHESHHDHHHHETPPTSAKSPVGSPTPTPQRKLVAVQGVVYCKPCKYRGVDTLTGAIPLTGAVVKLQCNNSKKALSEQAKTDKNGYFFFIPPRQLTTSGAHKCKVSLVSSPLPTCSVATGFNGGATGASLVPAAASDKNKKLPFQMFNVGPFAFEPTKDSPCP